MLRLAADAGLPFQVGELSLPQLYAAGEAFVTGTMGVDAVLRVDGRPIGDGDPGPVCRRLATDHAALTATSGTEVV